MVFFVLNLFVGQVNISLTDYWNSLFDFDSKNAAELSAKIFRIPKATTAILAGIALSISGLLMQTLFQNPLAGPYVLGLNSGASLLVALATMSGFSVFSTDLGVVSSALLGALIFGILILFTSIYVKSKVSLLLVGIMLGSFSTALINIVQSYSDAGQLKAFTLWSFGSLSNVQFEQLGWFAFVVLTVFLLSFILVKPLNLLVLGDQNAQFLGIKIKQVRFVIIIITAVLTGTVTALCGPIAFIGLAIPNIVKLIFKTTNHFYLLLGSALLGASLLLLCDTVIQLLSEQIAIPINAITALIGAPIVVWIILKKF
ncbi:MAG: iron chelate uptake ABC transporter family permease subunit [Lishizhenia sp.]